MNNQYHLSIMDSATSRQRCSRRALLSIAVFVLGAFGQSAHASSETRDSFCQTSIIRNYLAPLSQIKLTLNFDPEGRLTHGPRSLRIFVNQSQLVPIGKGEFGALGAVLDPKNRSASLNWWVTSRLEKVGASGDGKVLKLKKQFVKKVSGFSHRRFGFSSTAAKPGLYRLTVEIENTVGEQLDKYQEAYRAVLPKSALRLARSFDSLAAGERGWIRIDNYGTVPAEFGANYQLWNANAEEVTISPTFSNMLYLLPAGLRGPCYSFTVPSGLPPGEYRIGSRASDLIKRNQMLTTWFIID